MKKNIKNAQRQKEEDMWRTLAKTGVVEHYRKPGISDRLAALLTGFCFGGLIFFIVGLLVGLHMAGCR